MFPSIPASDKVSVIPSVISAGGSALDINGMCLTTSYRVPIGTVASFPSALSVGNYFGLSSTEYARAVVYFNGFDNSNKKPGAMLFTQYPQAAVGAWLQSGPITLAQINAAPVGTLTINTAGTPLTSSAINLAASPSPSSAAATIQAAFTSPPFNVTYDSVSGAFLVTTTATGATQTLDFAKSVTLTATAATTSGTTLTVAGTVTGSINIGDVVSGTQGANSLPANTTILAFGTGTGGAGTYIMSAAGTPGNLSAFALTATGYLGATAVALKLNQNSGAVLSQGAAAAVPATFMSALAQLTQNWVTFFTIFNPDQNTGLNTVKLAFGVWASLQGSRFIYICSDADATATTTVPATTSLGYLLNLANDTGTCLVWESTRQGLDAFVAGAAASVDYTEHEGCITFDFKGQSGLTPQVTSQVVAANLRANGYNYYGAWATANQGFNFFDPGSVTGPYDWLDAIINQVWLNNAFQLALMELLTNLKSLPYGPEGADLIKAACADPINQALNFGMFQAGVDLSAAQAAEVNNAAGLPIDSVLQTTGWYLQVLPAIAQVRAARQSPPITFWYIYRESVQQINLASVELQ